MSKMNSLLSITSGDPPVGPKLLEHLEWSTVGTRRTPEFCRVTQCRPVVTTGKSGSKAYNRSAAISLMGSNSNFRCEDRPSSAHWEY